jgi:hypothetical protein
MKHHTKDKGDRGTGNVIADLLSKGIQVCLPLSEHLPFDLIAVKNEGTLLRVSVKYREIKNGSVSVTFRSSYSDSKGVHINEIDKNMIDLIAIYCPQTSSVYYVDHTKFDKGVTLRIEETKNKQTKGVNFAKDYLIVP